MNRPLSEIVDDWYKNDPGWPLPQPVEDEIDYHVEDFMAADPPCRFCAKDVRQAILNFWESLQAHAR